MTELEKIQARHIAEVAAAGLETPGGNGSSSPTLVMSCAANIEPKPLRWVWPGKIPAGKLSLLGGDPDQGKSVITLDIAARITLGAPWPGDVGAAPAGDVIILSAEDDREDTIVPRLKAVGADLNRIYIVVGVKRGKGEAAHFSIMEDLCLLEAVMTETVRLIVIDPLSAYLGDDIDSYVNARVRRAVTTPLAALASRTGVAVLGVTHLNKGSGSPVYRFVESIGFIAAARSAWAVARDIQDESRRRRLLIPVKCNLVADPQALYYELVDCGGQPTIAWGENASADAAEALANETPEELSGIQEAIVFLQELLANKPVAASEVYKSAKACAISERTLKRAKKKLGVVSEKVDFTSGWFWRLPFTKGAKDAQEGQEDRALNLGPVGEKWPPSEKDPQLFTEFEVIK